MKETMDASLYRSAAEGDVDALSQHIDILDRELTPNHNTVLHIAAQFGHLEYVKEVLGECPSLLVRRNIKGETPLHTAAKEGRAEIVKAMMVRAETLDKEREIGWGGAVKKMLSATNVDGDTALHMAARNCHLGDLMYQNVVRLLTNQYAGFQYLPNNIQETPLYLAAERGDSGVAIVNMLVKAERRSTAVDMEANLLEIYASGPGGRTALHAAALNDFTGQSTRILLNWKGDLINRKDADGWAPLYYAACNGNKMGVKELLAKNKKGVYITTTNKDGLDTALHIAAARGHVTVIHELLSCNPDCWEMVNSQGQNFLHIAVYMNIDSVIEYIVSQPWVRHLINQKDNEGIHTSPSTYYFRLQSWDAMVPMDASKSRSTCFQWKKHDPRRSSMV